MRVLAQFESWWPPGPLLPSYLWVGDCFICGEQLDAYQTKIVEKDGDRCACMKHLIRFRGPSPEFPGFRIYSDG